MSVKTNSYYSTRPEQYAKLKADQAAKRRFERAFLKSVEDTPLYKNFKAQYESK